MITQDFPAIPPELVTYLEGLFPPKCPDLGASVQAIYHYAGKVAMVRYLRIKCDEQLETPIS